jgi:hypothetical protein
MSNIFGMKSPIIDDGDISMGYGLESVLGDESSRY